MSTEENKVIVRRSIEELWNRRNLTILDELYAESYHEPGITDSTKWREDLGDMFAAGVPADMHNEIEDQIAEGDKVVTRWTWSFTHDVKFLGAEPTGKHISWTGISIHRLKDGKLVEGWYNADELALFRQLGLIPQEEGGQPELAR
jgi:predicted ester cyclase